MRLPIQRLSLTCFTAGFLGLTLACSGGSGSDAKSGTSSTSTTTPPAAALHYTAPSNLQAGEYYLDVESGQDTKTLTFKVVSPSSGQSRGLGFFLSADPAKVAWVNAGGSDPYVREGSAYNLGTAPKLLRGRLSGGDLQAGLFQKGAITPATLNRTSVAFLTLSLKDTAAPGTVTLAPTSGQQAQSLNASGALEPVTLRVGVLEVK